MTNKEFLKRLGMEVRVSRIRKDWSQNDLAAMAKVGRETVGRIETASSDVKMITYKRVADALGTTLRDLLNFVG